MLWRQVGEDVKGCRRQIKGNMKGHIRDKLEETWKDAGNRLEETWEDASETNLRRLE